MTNQPGQVCDAQGSSTATFDEYQRTRDPRVRDALIEEHLWIARHGARRFAGRGADRDDLFQVASMALVKAVDRFDPERGLKFATYAMPTVIGELRRHFRDKTWSVRVPRRLTDLHVSIRTARDELTQILGRTPTVDEIAEQVDATAEDVLEAMEAGECYRAASIDQPRGEGQDGEVGIVPMDDEDLDGADDRVGLVDALEHLTERDRTVVVLRYFSDLTQSEIAEEVGVSQVHVSRILRSSLDLLRDRLEESA